jgi:hypothetical protein
VDGNQIHSYRVKGDADSDYKVALEEAKRLFLQSRQDRPIMLAQDYDLCRTPETLDRAQNPNHF